METPLEYYLAQLVQFNNKAEAQAIEDYTVFLQKVAESNLAEEDKEFIKAVIDEIIADELNHQEQLQTLFTMLTSVEPNED